MEHFAFLVNSKEFALFKSYAQHLVVDEPMFPFLRFFITLYYASNLRHREGAVDNRFWLHSLLMCILSNFAGGIVVSVLTGQMPYVFKLAEKDLPVIVLGWYLIQNFPGDVFYKLTKHSALKPMLLALVSISQMKSHLSILATAMKGSDDVYSVLLLGSLSGLSMPFFFNIESRLRERHEKFFLLDIPTSAQLSTFSTIIYLFHEHTSFLAIVRPFIGSIGFVESRMVMAGLYFYFNISLFLQPTARPFGLLESIFYAVTFLPRPRPQLAPVVVADGKKQN